MRPPRLPSDARAVARVTGRVRNQERRRLPDPTAGNPVYVDERTLEADAASVLFDSFPDDLHVLELTWATFLSAEADDDSMIYLDFNGDTLDTAAEDYRWHLAMADQSGSQGSATDSTLLREGGGIGYASPHRAGFGRVRFPAYNVDLTGPSAGIGPLWVGDGAWSDANTGVTDAWTVGGVRDNGAALTSILLSAARVSDNSAINFAAGARFTLTGY